VARGKHRGRYTPKRAGGKGGDDGASTRWLGTYGDAVTLLMAFFVMLYAMAEIDVIKFTAFVQGLAQPFANQTATEALLDGSPSIVGDEAVSAQPPTPQVGPEELARAPEPGEDAERPGDPAREQLEAVRAQIEEQLAEHGLAADIADFRHDERGLVVSIASDDVLFELGSAEIGRLGRRIVAALADVIGQHGNRVIVEGHTDNLPLRRPGYSNWNLSTDRAVAVVTTLVERHRIAPVRLSAVGYAEYHPRMPNDTPAQRAKNRRVDFVVVLGEGGAPDG
jgi:chemotaxis protein MotB